MIDATTVIIPAYCAASTIGRAIESVLQQTHVAAEIVVIDDGSPDDLMSAVARFGDRVRVMRKQNGGAGSARNLGIEQARTGFVAFLDADDYWEPAKLECQMAIFEEFPELSIVGSRWFEEPPGGNRYLAAVQDEGVFGRVVTAAGAEAFHVAMCMSTPTLLVRRAALKHHRFDVGLSTAEDRDLWIRLASDAPVYLCPEPLATAVLEPASLSRSDVDGDCGNMMRVVRRHAHLFVPDALRHEQAVVFRRWAAGHLGNGHPAGAIRPAWLRLCRQPWSPEAWWVLAKSVGWAAGRKSASRP